jgi:hypothetical protein
MNRTPPLMTLPSRGAQASTVHRPFTALLGRSIGSQRLCRIQIRSHFRGTLSRMDPRGRFA